MADRNFYADKGLRSEEEIKSFHDRLCDMPAYTMAVSSLSSIYMNTKERNEYLLRIFNMGESVTGKITAVGISAVTTATGGVLKVTKPIFGNLENPLDTIDSYGATVLRRVQEKLPIVKQTPNEMICTAKSSFSDAGTYCLDKVSSLAITQQVIKQLDNAVSISDLAVELCFPTDAKYADDIKDMEKLEENEGKCVLARAKVVKDKAYRRSTRKLMSSKPMKTTVDLIHHAQKYISQKTELLMNYSPYRSTASSSDSTEDGEKSAVEYSSCSDDTQSVAGDQGTGKTHLISKSWHSIYKNILYLPKKAVEVTDNVYVSAKQVVFQYTNMQTVSELPQALKQMTQSYYSQVKEDMQSANSVKDVAIAFVHIPTQTLLKSLQTNQTQAEITSNQTKEKNNELKEFSNDDDSSNETKQKNIELKEFSNNEDSSNQTKEKNIELKEFSNDHYSA